MLEPGVLLAFLGKKLKKSGSVTRVNGDETHYYLEHIDRDNHMCLYIVYIDSPTDPLAVISVRYSFSHYRTLVILEKNGEKKDNLSELEKRSIAGFYESIQKG